VPAERIARHLNRIVRENIEETVNRLPDARAMGYRATTGSSGRWWLTLFVPHPERRC